MDLPRIERHGDSWLLTWDQFQVGMGMERVTETRDGISATVIVESLHPQHPGRLLGPVKLNLISMISQASFTKSLEKALDDTPWSSMVVTACAIVYKQFTQPAPAVMLDEVDLSHARDDDYLLPGLIPLGETSLCYGDSESLKSMLASLIAVCLTYRLSLPWGARPATAAKVLYADWETNEVVLAERMHRLALGLGLEVRPKISYRGTIRAREGAPSLRMLIDEVQSLREQIQREHIGLVIVDSIGFAVDGKLVDDDVARAALSALRQLTPATRLVVAHISKESVRQGAGRVDPFGSVFFRAGMRSGFEVRRAEDDLGDEVDVGIYHWKSNDGMRVPPFGLHFTFEPNAGAIRVRKRDLEASPDLAMRTPLSTRLRGLLKSGAAPVFDLAEQLGVDPKVVDTTLRRMPDATRLDGGGRGEQARWGLRG